MKSTLQSVFLLAATGVWVAQGQHRKPADTVPLSRLDMTKVQTVSGTVGAVAIGYGMQYPSITIGKVQIKVAPVWYLLDNNFEIKVGDVLTVQAAPALATPDPYLYAIEIANAADQRILLRDVLGRPLWTNSQAGGPATTEGSCLLGSPAVAAGIVEQINSGVGIQMPTLTLKLSDGTLLTFKLGPERILLESDLELK